MAFLKRLRIVFPAAILALAGHAVAYGTFWPAGTTHGYFGWYEPLLGTASGVAFALLGSLLLFGLAGSAGAKRWLQRIVPSGSSGFAAAAHRLALMSLALLLLQESLESSLSSGRLVPGTFSGTSLLLLVAFLWLTAVAALLAARTYAALARNACRPPRVAARSFDSTRPSVLSLRFPRPLASGRALRAPPRLLPA